MSLSDPALIRQADYVKSLKAFLPKAAFQTNLDRVIILLINLAILMLGWGIASYLDRWVWYALWLYLPLTLIMANSVIVLLFSIHDVMHGSLIKNRALLQLLSLVALAPMWMPPTLWRILHNQVHHSHTNSVRDPDRQYLSTQPMTWGKWIQNFIAPSAKVNRCLMVIGMMFAWGIHGFRNLTSILLFNSEQVDYVPASFTVKPKERAAIAIETVMIIGLHFCVLSYLQFDPIKLLLSYFLPIGLGYAGIIFYVYTNHMLCPLSDVNDPLVNSTSLRVPALFNALHFNFSYHAEHHIFPGLNSSYYPMLQDLIKVHYPSQPSHILDAQEAWKALLTRPQDCDL